MENRNKHACRIGDVYLLRFDGTGNEQQGIRPAMVFQNNTGNTHSPNIVVLPLTTSLKKLANPTHVLLHATECGLKKDSIVLCENPTCVSKDRLTRYLTRIPASYLRKIATATLLASSIISYLDPDGLLSTWEKASMLNASSF